VERFRCPADSLKGDHELTYEPFPGRVCSRLLKQLVHNVVMVTQSQLDLEQVLHRRQPPRLQGLVQRM
jgi:hypothetical protein